MNQELSAMFKEKNNSLLKKKLSLDIDNNMDSLLKSLNNILGLEITNATTRLQNIYDDAKISVDNDTLEEIINKVESQFRVETGAYLKERKNKLFDFLEESEVNEEFLEAYLIEINKVNDYKEYIEDRVNTYVNKEVETIIKKSIKAIKDSEMKEFTKNRLLDYLTHSFVMRLISKTSTQLQYRNNTLINNAKESYTHYQNLSF